MNHWSKTWNKNKMSLRWSIQNGFCIHLKQNKKSTGWSMIISMLTMKLTFLQALNLYRETWWRDVVLCDLPLAPSASILPQFLKLHSKALDGEAPVSTRDPRHVSWSLWGCGYSRSIWSFRGYKHVNREVNLSTNSMLLLCMQIV